MVDYCESNPCQNEAACIVGESGAQCLCKKVRVYNIVFKKFLNLVYSLKNFSGKFCEFLHDKCSSNPCHNNGTCIPNQKSFTCKCMLGVGGKFCEKDIYNECISNPCTNNGKCLDKFGFYHCDCPRFWNGINCERYDKYFTGGIGKAPSSGPPIPPPLDRMEQMCREKNCPEKAGNGRCDEECNNYACRYDSMDCSYDMLPFKNCSAIKHGVACYALANNNKCDEACNNEECLYDGFDCAEKECNVAYGNYCAKNYNNGICDEECNVSECGLDGGDCSGLDKPLEGTIVIHLSNVSPNQFRDQEEKFLFSLGKVLRGVVKVALKKDGAKMIYPWIPNQSRVKRYIDLFLQRFKRAEKIGTKVVLTLTNSDSCGKECFKTVDKAAEYLAHSLQNGDYTSNFKFDRIQGIIYLLNFL